MTMNNLVQFIYESGICLAVLFALYWLTLRKETYFRFNRFYLLGSIAVACLLPLGNFSLSVFSPEASSAGILPQMAEAFSIPELTFSEGSAHTRVWQPIALAIYLTVAVLLMVRTILGIIRVSMLKKEGRTIHKDTYSIVFLKQDIAPFSFFNTIFINEALIDNPDKKHIVDHEIIHIKQGHTYDIIGIEFLLAISWFNPFMWLLKAALRNTHEYLADHGAIHKTPSLAEYQALLLKQISGLSPLPVTNSFNSTIKNRIKMMCRNNSSLSAKLKPLLLVPVLTCLTLLFACNENDLLLESPESFDELVEENDTQTEAAIAEEEVFYIVEEMPTFNGGEPAMEFRKYIAQNLRYPVSATKIGTEGRVIIQFAIDKDGKVVDAVVVRSVDPALDEEAVRVVMSSPDWTPGKQRGKAVKVLFTFPINFIIP